MDPDDDYNNSIIDIKPTLKNKTKILHKAVSEGLPVFNHAFTDGLLADSVNILAKLYRRRKTADNYEQYVIPDNPSQKMA